MTEALAKWQTWQELQRQPAIWRDWGAQLDVAGIRDWIAAQSVDSIWFCGAGTSAYIGDILAAALPGTRSVPTTDIVAQPRFYLSQGRPLVVNFGRSGDSAETIGTLDALDALAPDAPRLNITCNPDGALAKRTGSGPTKVVLLPEATHDAGFAMTSSFTTMLLTALALFDAPCDVAERCNRLAAAAEALLPAITPGPVPQRAVFLGTGPLAFAAREAALKVMELSAGQIPALWDSTLGFRHGPKSFVMDQTCIMVLTGAEGHAARYEADLIAELRAQFPAARVVSVGPGGDLDIPMPFGEAWSVVLSVFVAQVCGVVWAEALGLNVDDPFAGQGTLSRVVSGVTLYPVAS